MYYESENIELKEKFVESLPREIVAFLNSNGGKIFIGIGDDGNILGIDNDKIDEVQRKIADCISLQIEPNPQNEIETHLLSENGKKIIRIDVPRGLKPIYCYKKYGLSPKGCLIRVGTTCREMSLEEIKNKYQYNFTDNDFLLQAPANYPDIKFEMLKILLVSRGYHINEESFESTYSLRRKDGSYNLLAELLSDSNSIPFICVKFMGNDKSSMSRRNDYGEKSILLAYQRMKDRLIAENICKTNTTVRPRIDEYLYDIDAVNEALVNAIAHNDWTLSEPLVSFFNDRLEITSHGGLVNGITKEEFFEGVSRPRNTVLMRILLKLGISEHTGHGIPTIISKYGKKAFDIHDNYINVIIPFNKNVLDNHGTSKPIDKEFDEELTPNEKRLLLEIISDNNPSYDSLVDNLEISRRTLSRCFKGLTDKGYIKRVGNNKTGYWVVIK